MAHGDGIGIESKSAAPDCTPCGRDTLGLLTRRHLALESVALIGKESNSYDEVEAGAIQDWDDVLNVYSRAGARYVVSPLPTNAPYTAALATENQPIAGVVKSAIDRTFRPRPCRPLGLFVFVIAPPSRPHDVVSRCGGTGEHGSGTGDPHASNLC